MSSVLEKKFSFADTNNGDVIYVIDSYQDDYTIREFTVLEKSLNLARRGEGKLSYTLVLHQDIFRNEHDAALEISARIHRKVGQLLDQARGFKVLAKKLIATKE